MDLTPLHTISSNTTHEINQKILGQVKEKLGVYLRISDTFMSLDKHEFAILLSDLDHPKVAGLVAEKLLDGFKKTFQIESQENLLSCNIGIALFPEDGHKTEDLQEKAMAALYQAKQLGGNQYQYSQPQRTLEAREHAELQAALRQAIKHQEFSLYYQPKMELKTRCITGVEALLRWEHPRFGLIDPLKFIASAEESGLMMEIGEWALRQACQANKQWQSQGYQAISVAVNLSPKQLFHPQILDTINKILKETGLDPQYLELEITEMTILDDIQKLKPLLEEIHRLGISLALDDFGTGYTALQSLKNFPINTLKIDQSFIKSLPEDLQNAAITKALITLGHQLGCRVVAEGVETQEQLQFLADQDCDYAQGYFVSRPLAADKIREQLKHIP